MSHKGSSLKPLPISEISFFGKRLILVVSAAVRKLGGCDIQDSFSGFVRDQMEET